MIQICSVHSSCVRIRPPSTDYFVNQQTLTIYAEYTIEQKFVYEYLKSIIKSAVEKLKQLHLADIEQRKHIKHCKSKT